MIRKALDWMKYWITILLFQKRMKGQLAYFVFGMIAVVIILMVIGALNIEAVKAFLSNIFGGLGG